MKAVWHPSFKLKANLLEGDALIRPGDKWLERRVGSAVLVPNYRVRKGVFDADDTWFFCPETLRPNGNVTLVVLSWKQWPLCCITRTAGLPLELIAGDICLNWDNGPFKICARRRNPSDDRRVFHMRRWLLANATALDAIEEGTPAFQHGGFPRLAWWDWSEYMLCL